MENVEEDKETISFRVVDNRVLENCRCNELRERSERAELRCGELLLELQKKKNDCERLESKFKALEVEKFSMEEELRALKTLSEGLEEKFLLNCGKDRRMTKVVDLTEEDDKVTQLMIENSVLELEKKKAELEVEGLKEKCKNLESLLGLELAGFGCNEDNGQKQASEWIKPEGNSHLGTSLEFQNQERVADLVNVASSISQTKVAGDMQRAGTPSSNMGQRRLCLDSKFESGRKIRKQLTFDTEGSPRKKMAPSTPIEPKSASVSLIYIDDSDNEPNVTQLPITDAHGSGSASEKEKISQMLSKKDLHSGEDALFVATPKRKRNYHIVTSDSENDDDVPISKLIKSSVNHVILDRGSAAAPSSVEDQVTGTTTPRRRLRKSEESIPTNEVADDNELSDSEDESLNDFIVDDSYVSVCEDASSKSEDVPDGDVDSDSCKSQDSSDEDMDFDEILSKISRKKDHKMEWELEGDMLAAFGKDPCLCMRAVCALYRQQTSDERTSKGTFHRNHRGFSTIHALRGSELAEFLTDGDPYSGLIKSVEELQGHDPKALELCRTLAIQYSKQLFEIYQKKEDPYFP